VNGVPTTLPYELKGMRVMPAGWQLILTIDEFNLEVRYDEMNHGFVIMMPQTTYKDRTKGLCGKKHKALMSHRKQVVSS